MSRKVLFITFYFASAFIFGNNPDSLLNIAKTQKHDTAYVLLLTRAADQFDERGEYDKAISICMNAKKIADSLHYKIGQQAALNRMGNCYIDMGRVKKALECHLQVLKIREELGDKGSIGYTWLNLGNIYFRMGEEDNALKSYGRSMEMLQLAGDSMGVATTLANMGSIYSNKLQTKKAEEHYLKALAIRKRMGNTDGIAEIYSNLSIVFMDAQNYKQALIYAFKTINLYGASGNKLGKAISYSNIGDIYEHLNEYNNAIKYQEISLNMAKEMKSLYMMQTCYQLLSVAYAKKNDYEKALYHYEMYSQTTDSMMNSENSKLIAELQTKFETEKKEQEIQLLQKDKNIRELLLSEQETNIHRQKIVIYSVIGGMMLIVLLIFFIWKSYREKKKINLGLEKKNIEINEQRNEIAEKNTLITDSIEYARSIQNAILPDDDVIKKVIPDSFILFLPKDIVSGDFYWLSCSPDKFMVAAIDCTGHGVPGAFMSVMAYNMLENIVAEKKLIQPSLILDELNTVALETLHQGSETSSAKYGMDISLVAIDRKKGVLQFAGAHNSLLLVDTEGKTLELKADNATIGMALGKFSNHQTELKEGTMLYMFTDGFPDQKGGAENKKFFSGEFKKLLASIASKSVSEQKEVLHQTFLSWKGANEQMDDILVIGFRI